MVLMAGIHAPLFQYVGLDLMTGCRQIVTYFLESGGGRQKGVGT